MLHLVRFSSLRQESSLWAFLCIHVVVTDEPETGAPYTVDFRPLFICCGVLLLCQTPFRSETRSSFKAITLSICHEALGYCAGPTKFFRPLPDGTSTQYTQTQSSLSMGHLKEKKRHKSESETHQLDQLPPAPCCHVLLSNMLSNHLQGGWAGRQTPGLGNLLPIVDWAVARWGRQIRESRYKWAA